MGQLTKFTLSTWLYTDTFFCVMSTGTSSTSMVSRLTTSCIYLFLFAYLFFCYHYHSISLWVRFILFALQLIYGYDSSPLLNATLQLIYGYDSSLISTFTLWVRFILSADDLAIDLWIRFIPDFRQLLYGYDSSYLNLESAARRRGLAIDLRIRFIPNFLLLLYGYDSSYLCFITRCTR